MTSFFLDPRSPCIGAGTALSGENLADPNGIYPDEFPDIGAYEYYVSTDTPILYSGVVQASVAVTGAYRFRWVQSRGQVKLSWWQQTTGDYHMTAWEEKEERQFYTASPVRAGEKWFYPLKDGTLAISGFYSLSPVVPLTGQFYQLAQERVEKLVYQATLLPKGKAHDLNYDIDIHGSGAYGASPNAYALVLADNNLYPGTKAYLETEATILSGQIASCGAPKYYDGAGQELNDNYVFPATNTVALLARYGTGAVSGWIDSLLLATSTGNLGSGYYDPVATSGMIAADYHFDGSVLSGIPFNTGTYPRQIEENNDYRILEMLPSLAMAAPYYEDLNVLTPIWVLDELRNFQSRTSGTCYGSNGTPYEQSDADHYGRLCTYGGYTLWYGCQVHYHTTHLSDILFSELKNKASYAGNMLTGTFINGGKLYKGVSRLVAAFGYLGLTGYYELGRKALLLNSIDLNGVPREPKGCHFRPQGTVEPPSDIFSALAMGDGSWLWEIAKAAEAYGTGDYGMSRDLYAERQVNGGELDFVRGMLESLYYGQSG